MPKTGVSKGSLDCSSDPEEEGAQSDSSEEDFIRNPEGSLDCSSDPEEEGAQSDSSEKDFIRNPEGELYYAKKDKNKKQGIKLTGYSLVFFKAVETTLEARKKDFLAKLFPNFLKSCQNILRYCPGMSTFNGSWRRESSNFLSVDEARKFVGDDFFKVMICLFDETLKGKNLTISQTEQILGAFFISSLLKLYGEIVLQGFFEDKLRSLAEKLKDDPLAEEQSNGKEQGLNYISAIFQPNIFATNWVLNAQEQFEVVFQNLELQDKEPFTDLLTLFFLKPFPFEIIMNSRFITDNFRSKKYDITPFVQALEKRISRFKSIELALNPTQTSVEFEQPLVEEAIDSVKESKHLMEEQSLVEKHSNYVKTAFKIIKKSLKVVGDAAAFKILGQDKILDEFGAVIKIEAPNSEEVNIGSTNTDAVRKLNPIFHQYFVALHAGKCQKNDFYNILEASSITEKLENIISAITIKLNMTLDENNLSLTQTVLSPPQISLGARLDAVARNESRNSFCEVLINPLTLQAVTQSHIEFTVHRAEFLQGKRRFICCHPRNRETSSALLNANPLVKALLLSQVPIAVVLQILRVDNNFKAFSTVMWFEPGLGLIGFACGVYALKNPQRLVNTPVRILEALSASSVVLTKSLGIAILAHTELFPKEGEQGGIDIERFLKVVASVPITVALLSWVYNSLNPHFKERHFSRCVRFNSELINSFAIYCGLNQIISIDIVKIMNRIEKIDFSTRSSRILLELLPMVPALFFAYTRVAPIRLCRRSDVYVNISETINTAVLYGFTTVLLTNLAIDLSLTDNLPEAQINFRRAFFPGLMLASMAMMARFARSFPVLYEGNPEVIIQQVINERGLQSRDDGNFSLGSNLPLLADSRVGSGAMGSDGEDNVLTLKYEEVKLLEEGLKAHGEYPEEKGPGKETLVMQTLHRNKNRQQNDEYTRQRYPANNKGKSGCWGSCVML